MEQARTQARTEDHTYGPAYRAGGRVDQQSRQQWGGMEESTFLSGSGEMGKLQDTDANPKMVSHDDGRFTPSMEKILDTQRTLDAHAVSQQAAPRLNAPVLRSVPVKLAAGLPGDYAGHGTQVRFK